MRKIINISEMTDKEVENLLIPEKKIKIRIYYNYGYKGLVIGHTIGKTYHKSRKITKDFEAFVKHTIKEFDFELVRITGETELLWTGRDWDTFYTIIVK